MPTDNGQILLLYNGNVPIIAGEIMKTIHDVAKAAGCSKSTVSRAFANPETVHPKTLAKVMEVAKALDYTPNAVARAMITKRTENIGFIIFQEQTPAITNPFYGPILEHVVRATRARGYSLFISSDDDLRLPSGEIMLRKQVDGVILASLTDANTVYAFQSKGIPTVLLNYSVSLDHYSILSDDTGGISGAVEYLHSRGARRIGLLAGRFTPFIYGRRYDAYTQAMAQLGLEPDARFIKTVEPTIQDSFAGMQAILAQRERPDAMVCTNDKVAAGAIKAIVRAGLRVPEDIAVTGYDNSELCGVCEPEITSVDPDTHQLGNRAVEMLFSLIDGAPPAQRIVTIPTCLKVRGSTK